MSAAAIWLGVVLLLGVSRDVCAAISMQSWRPLRYYGHWGVAFLTVAIAWLSYKALTVPLELDSPAHRQLAERSRLSGICVGAALSLYFVNAKSFWTVDDK
jgi:hypothetical protein